MADLPPSPDTDDDSGVGPDRQSTPGMPRWVKVFLIIGIVVVLLFVTLLLFGGGPGRHGPGRHAPYGAAVGQAPPVSVQEDPPGGDGTAHDPSKWGH